MTKVNEDLVKKNILNKATFKEGDIKVFTTAVNANLDALKKEIDTFVRDVKLASQIVSRIDKVIGLAAKFFMP
ncbi:MAG: hypothetical protein HY607_05635 [Planctomycetes bacterium]|nr:hypothetical protein [Planctomycetota bacterium]